MPASRRTIVAWTLDDVANSALVAVIPATVYSEYYALVVVGNERGQGDFWWGLAVTASMAIVAVSSPPLGAIADHAGLRKRFFTTPEVIQLYFVGQLSALAGAWAWARPTDSRGPRLVVVCTLVQWCVVVVAAYFVVTKAQVLVVAAVAGTAPGAVPAASRVFMASPIPRGEEAELSGFYALCGKTAVIFGPTVFGVVSRLTGGNQRAAILAIGAFFVAGLALVSRVNAGGPTGAAPRPS